jgi:hypothetical protein
VLAPNQNPGNAVQPRSRHFRVGRTLLLTGTILMLTGTAAAAATLPRLVANISVEVLGAPAAAALVLLRFLRTIAFHPSALLPYACGILVLFFALAGILAGLLLLRNRTVEKA